jgi:hypothetical protein
MAAQKKKNAPRKVPTTTGSQTSSSTTQAPAKVASTSEAPISTETLANGNVSTSDTSTSYVTRKTIQEWMQDHVGIGRVPEL